MGKETSIDVLAAEVVGLENRRAAARQWARDLAPTLRQIFEDCDALSLQIVADRLNADHIPARRGGKWQRAQVMRLVAIGDDQSITPRQMIALRGYVTRLRIEMPDHPHTRRLRLTYLDLVRRRRIAARDAAEVQRLVRDAIGGQFR